jgi:IS605 OrfB family transposase
MNLTAQVKLQPDREQATLLKVTLERANAMCNAISAYAWAHKKFGKGGLQKDLYHDLRATFALSAQVVIRALAKVADAYKKDRRAKRHFRPHGSIAYDSRILSLRMADRTVSIWTVEGRQVMPFLCGGHHWDLLQEATKHGESKLIYRDGDFYLHVSCEIEEAPLQEADEALGVDLGVINIAVDSDGETYTSNANAHINSVRYRYRRLRRKLQKKGTKSARRLLKKRRRRESRFAKDTNHCISKQIVNKAQGTGRAIALEDLGGIRDRLTVRRHQRATLHSWSFYDLQQKIIYKARRAGVPVVKVDPRNTSRTCPACGHIDKKNRPTQAHFSCVSCGFSGAADHIAAIIIGRRAAGMHCIPRQPA